jgi:hypothetical protein
MTSTRVDGYCKECDEYTQNVSFDITGLCQACEYKKEQDKTKKEEGDISK